MVKREGLYRIKLANIKRYKYYHLETTPKDFNQEHWLKILEDTKKKGDVSVPIVVTQDQDGKYLLEDGYRRYCAATECEIPVVTAMIIPVSKKQNEYPRFIPFDPKKLIDFLKKVLGMRGLPS